MCCLEDSPCCHHLGRHSRLHSHICIPIKLIPISPLLFTPIVITVVVVARINIWYWFYICKWWYKSATLQVKARETPKTPQLFVNIKKPETGWSEEALFYLLLICILCPRLYPDPCVEVQKFDHNLKKDLNPRPLLLPNSLASCHQPGKIWQMLPLI